MSNAKFYELSDLSVIDISGADSAAIVNNLTTNEVLSLAASMGRETFVTDVRGKTLGHVVLVKQSDGIRLIGPPGQSEAISAHIDRYTIREDATATIRDSEFTAFVLTADDAGVAKCQSENVEPIAHFNATEQNLDAYRTRWLGEGTVVLLVPKPDVDEMSRQLSELSLTKSSLDDFHQRRIETGFPWYGIDLDDSNLPQELNRDGDAISFTKGCYLGQETVARLDALGQVQRKLVRWRIDGPVPAIGAILEAGEKKVGRLTSLAQSSNGEFLALGFARRSHFDSGAVANGTDPTTGAAFTGTVL